MITHRKFSNGITNLFGSSNINLLIDHLTIYNLSNITAQFFYKSEKILQNWKKFQHLKHFSKHKIRFFWIILSWATAWILLLLPQAGVTFCSLSIVWKIRWTCCIRLPSIDLATWFSFFSYTNFFSSTHCSLLEHFGFGLISFCLWSTLKVFISAVVNKFVLLVFARVSLTPVSVVRLFSSDMGQCPGL